MPSTFSPDKAYELMATSENDGTWGNKTNANLSIIDLNFGGRLPINVAGNSDVTVSSTQAENVYHLITGALTGNIHYDLPNAGSFYILDNSTTGAYTLTARALSGTGIIIPQGTKQFVFVNPDVSALSQAFSYGSTGSVNTYTAQQNFAEVAITSASNSIAWDLNIAQTARHTLTENTTLANPTNQVAGGTYIIRFIQAASAKALAFGSAYKWAGGVAPVVSTGSGAIDVYTFVSNGTNMYGAFQQNFS